MVAVGRDNIAVLLTGIQDFRKKVDTVGMTYEFKETDGGHTWPNWRKYLTEFTRKIFK